MFICVPCSLAADYTTSSHFPPGLSSYSGAVFPDIIRGYGGVSSPCYSPADLWLHLDHLTGRVSIQVHMYVHVCVYLVCDAFGWGALVAFYCIHGCDSSPASWAASVAQLVRTQSYTTQYKCNSPKTVIFKEKCICIVHTKLFIQHITHRPLNGPLFFLDLVLDSEGSHYSQDLSSFQPTLVNVFDRGISSTHTVPMVEKVPHMCIHVHASLAQLVVSPRKRMVVGSSPTRGS